MSDDEFQCPDPSILVERCVAHFRSQPDRLAKASLGAACEQWLNTELFLAYNFIEPSIFVETMWACTEDKKIDLAIVRGSTKPYQLYGYVENKAVYANGKHAGPIYNLSLQLHRAKDGVINQAPRLGFIFSCWSSYWRCEHSAFIERVEFSIQKTFATTTAMRLPCISLTDRTTLQWQMDRPEVEVCLHPIVFHPR
ncbi:MAG: hypothetical protein H7144_01185 [Burkholderiales bacterium]|nr:hypothetical protein [Phycisphaerae bacterium]